MDTFFNDLRFSLRLMMKSRAFTLTAALHHQAAINE